MKKQIKKKPINIIDWRSDLKNYDLNVYDRYNRVINKASKLEEEAGMKEKILKISKDDKKNLDLEEQASNMYVDAIKAKLAIFNEFK